MARRKGIDRPHEIHINLSEEEQRVLHRMCDSDDVSMSQLIRRLIRDAARDRGIIQPRNLQTVSK